MAIALCNDWSTTDSDTMLGNIHVLYERRNLNSESHLCTFPMKGHLNTNCILHADARL